MTTLLMPLAALSAFLSQPIDSRFVQVAPAARPVGVYLRSPGQPRAVVLIHGLGLHFLSRERVEQAELRSWQQPGSTLVRALAGHADVYSFAYAQNAPVEEVAERAALRECVQLLRGLRYAEIVLVGHSAGGLVARQFVEDFPDAGVTKVLQVCAPNSGCGWAAVQLVRSNQVPFLNSLSRTGRQLTLEKRADRRIPASVEFACVVGTCRVGGDLVVVSRSQWPEDLQEQGIPLYPLRVTHYDAMINHRTAELVAQLIRQPLPRWPGPQVQRARKTVLGE